VLIGEIANTVESVESSITVIAALAIPLLVVGLIIKVVAGVAKGSPPETMKGSNRVDGFAAVVVVSSCS
jgi:hypothetical protein